MPEISIKPDREYLREICSKIDAKKYAIPVFQRDYVWKREQILDLFDSILKGYPIGTIMLWKPIEYHQPETKDILTDETRKEPVPEYYVLDGRQRLTTFYGCVSKRPDKDGCFNLCYNLETDSFEYAKKEQIEIMSVADIYDTFSMLQHLQDIMNKVKDETKQKKYVERAKKMNAILQSYETGEILIDNCSLEEAGIVFSRINSKGTKISKASMLQAISYKKKDGILLSKEIDDILDRLSFYSFNHLSSDDILNCFYRWSSKDFYNAKMNDLENFDFTTHLPEIRLTIETAVRFLHNKCYVLSSDLIPYKKQLIALTWFFKEKKEPTEQETMELIKWFFYTTYCQTFQNSSLSNVRSIFRRFEEYIKEEKPTAMDYEPIKIDDSDLNKFTINSAKANFMLLSQIYHYQSFEELSGLSYRGYIRIGGNDAAFYYPEIKDQDKEVLTNCFYFNGNYSDDYLKKYLLDKDMLKCFISGDKETFASLRKSAIVEQERKLLLDSGIEIDPMLKIE